MIVFLKFKIVVVQYFPMQKSQFCGVSLTNKVKLCILTIKSAF